MKITCLKNKIRRNDNLQKEVHIALVGKYTQLEDSYASVTKALQHAAIASGYRLKLKVISAKITILKILKYFFC
jgi:CTP synthase (UTP-ammonia lyase)